VVEIGGGLSLAIGLFTRLAELALNADAIGAIVLLAWYTARSPATSRRSITSSASLAAAEQVNSASPPQMRMKIRYSRRRGCCSFLRLAGFG